MFGNIISYHVGNCTGTETAMSQYISYRMIPDRHSKSSKISDTRPAFFRSWTVLLGRLALSVGLFASCERFALELGPSDLDFARLDSPRDGLDVVFGSRNGVICKVSGERMGFVASIDFSYDFHVFSKLFFDRLISQFSIMSSIACAFDRKRLRWLKPGETLAGATKIKVRR